MAIYKGLKTEDIKTTRSVLNQLIDFTEADISGSVSSRTRKKYKVFITSSNNYGITSSLFQTVFDQDHELQTANELFDMTVGLFSGSHIVATASSGLDTSGKVLFPSKSLMMREKIDIYRQHAQILLGDANSQFIAPFGSELDGDKIGAALFINFKRLFTRDSIKRETFAMRFFRSGSSCVKDEDGSLTLTGQTNLDRATVSGSSIFTDAGSLSSINQTQGGNVGNIINASNTSENNIGLIFYDHGICVLNLETALSSSQLMSGSIDAVGSATSKVVMKEKFSPNFLISGSIDNIVDHLASTRMGSGSLTGMTFQNNTNIYSTLYFCRAAADEFNYSSNPTYIDENTGKIIVIPDNRDLSQLGKKSFSFITSVGMYGANDDLLAVAKLSRPIEKNDEKDLTIRVRLDY